MDTEAWRKILLGGSIQPGAVKKTLLKKAGWIAVFLLLSASVFILLKYYDLLF